jgi:hypothetical protein
MKITVRRSGGFAGLSENLASVDTTDLHPEKASEISKILESAAATKPDANPVGADIQRYEIKIEDKGKERLIRFSEDSPDSERLLGVVRQLQSLS